jgi:hypothetical protein
VGSLLEVDNLVVAGSLVEDMVVEDILAVEEEVLVEECI